MTPLLPRVGAAGALLAFAAGAAGQAQAPARIPPCGKATFHPPAVTRCTVALDDGTAVTVDTTAALAPVQVSALVLAADRSTVSGCPFGARAKGLIRGGADGDRVFVADGYVAWFDYTAADGNSAGTAWYRSGALAGFWPLDPAAGTFRSPFDPARKAAGDAPNADGICWSWARNELIPGSNSPRGQRWFWDTYAPPTEHTVVFGTTKASTGYSTMYAQRFAARGSRFVVRADGVQDGAGVHYATEGLLTSEKGGTSFTDPASGRSGSIAYALDFACRPAAIEVTWTFSASATATPLYVYAGLWAAYAGLGEAVSKPSWCPGEAVPAATPTPRPWNGHTTCGVDATEPVPAMLVGVPPVPGAVFHSYNWFQCSLPYTELCQAGYAVTRFPAPGSVAPFPWAEEVPCYVSYGFGTDPVTQGGKRPAPPAYLGIPRGATAALAFDQATSGGPVLRVTNLVDPDQGAGTRDAPAGYPLQQMGASYESNDQQQGLTLATSWPYAYALGGGVWYRIGYSITGR
ncbi:MAG TPA: hypothetical protein VLW17_08310 [Thermoanaerobaculaceae bacterium]|nr:hypothetical protein [Thermoanaerobaculaceae bacterium]